MDGKPGAGPLPTRYDARELEGLPAPVQRYFRATQRHNGSGRGASGLADTSWVEVIARECTCSAWSSPQTQPRSWLAGDGEGAR